MVDWSKYPNFSKSEFDCRHTGNNLMRPELLDVLQQARDIYGKPMIVTSGYRDPSHPVERSKANRGEHTYGLAVDISVPREDMVGLITVFFNLGVKRIGIKINSQSRFLHIGVGDQFAHFPPVPWTY